VCYCDDIVGQNWHYSRLLFNDCVIEDWLLLLLLCEELKTDIIDDGIVIEIDSIIVDDWLTLTSIDVIIGHCYYC